MKPHHRRASGLLPLLAAGLVVSCLLPAAAQVGDATSGVRAEAHANADADPAKLLPPDRWTAWQPGLMAQGGIPTRTKVCARLTPLGVGKNDAIQIQEAINACRPGEVLELAAGTFNVNSGRHLIIHHGITLRGAGPGQTILAKSDGAKPLDYRSGPNSSPIIIVGPARYSGSKEPSGVIVSTDLVADAAKGARSITVANPAGFAAGQIVLLDEVSGAGWQDDSMGRGQVWAAPDFRVVWRKHNPAVPFSDHFAPEAFPTTPGTAGSWFSRQDRPTAELKEIASVSGSTITFTSPVHISYRTRHAAQLSRFWKPFVKGAGVEELTLQGGDSGNLRFQWAAHSWARNVESTAWLGEGIAVDRSFRVELREFYVHDGVWAQPGGGGYCISLSGGSSEVLIENGISVRANKVMVARSSGAGSVVGYNYFDMGYINSNGSWIEVGLNASHMVGPHHVLFEGNYGHNADSDNTHGNSIYLTFFRNHLRGIRAPFDNQSGGRIDDAVQPKNGPKRAAGLTARSYWMSFVGNVLGAEGQMRGWDYETTFTSGKPGIWMLGWDDQKPNRVDPQVAATAIRHGNFDYVTNSVRWDPKIETRALPSSLYLSQRPAFFDAGKGYVWPWVDPVGATKLHTLPAKARFDAGTPFAQP